MDSKLLAKNILKNTYTASDCTDFNDIAMTLDSIFRACEVHNVCWNDDKSVAKRVMALYRKFKTKPEKYAKQSDINAFAKYYPMQHKRVLSFLNA